MMIKIRSIVAYGEWRLPGRHHKRSFWGDGNILHLGWDKLGIFPDTKFVKTYWVVHLISEHFT